MSIGLLELLGLLDDVAAIAKVAAASLDEVAAHAAKASAKAATIANDDTAVTPPYVLGFSTDPRIANRRQDCRRLASKQAPRPTSLYFSGRLFFPRLLTPLLMLGGVYLCYEGAEKVFKAIVPQSC